MWCFFMKRNLMQRIDVAVAATVIGALCGLLTGSWIGWKITLQRAATLLAREATFAIKESLAFSRDAHAAFDAMNAARNPDCSDEDIEFLRKLLYNSYLLKEIGRIRDNKIACSTTLGREHLPGVELPKTGLVGADGVKVYHDPPYFQLPNVPITVLQSGNSYLVLNHQVSSLRGSNPMHLRTTVIGPTHELSAQPAGGAERLKWEQLSRDGDFYQNEALYSTRCSHLDINNICMTASLSNLEVLQDYHFELMVFLILGGLIGAIFGLLLSFAYRRNQSLEKQLRRAIRKDELRVVYQQVVSLASGRIVGAEALARWTDKEGVAVQPDVFIKIAEDNGFVNSITRLVVRHVLRDFAETLRTHPDFRMSINIAAMDLTDPWFLPMLESALKGARVKAQSLIFEITESCTARHEMAIAAILHLHQRGHSVHIDDFGTGYSSLSYLQDLSVDGIKIDRTFTQSIGTEAVTAAILPQILAMARGLNLQVVVEGIETMEQAEYFASQAQPILGQGWLFGHPITADAFHHLLSKQDLPPVAA